MLGFARLNRASLIVDAMESCSKKRFARFVASCQFDQRLEFDEGDLGLPGGFAMYEDSKLHVQTREAIRRFGGTTSADAPWPEDRQLAASHDAEDDGEKLARIEKIVAMIAKKANTIAANRRNGGVVGGVAAVQISDVTKSTDDSSSKIDVSMVE